MKDVKEEKILMDQLVWFGLINISEREIKRLFRLSVSVFIIFFVHQIKYND